MRDQLGVSTTELAITSAVTALLLLGVGSMLISGLGTGSFGTSQARSVDDARTVVNQLVRDVQNSDDWDTTVYCGGAAAGSCASISVKGPGGTTRRVRWRLAGSTLYRE